MEGEKGLISKRETLPESSKLFLSEGDIESIRKFISEMKTTLPMLRAVLDKVYKSDIPDTRSEYNKEDDSFGQYCTPDKVCLTNELNEGINGCENLIGELQTALDTEKPSSQMESIFSVCALSLRFDQSISRTDSVLKKHLGEVDAEKICSLSRDLFVISGNLRAEIMNQIDALYSK